MERGIYENVLELAAACGQNLYFMPIRVDLERFFGALPLNKSIN